MSEIDQVFVFPPAPDASSVEWSGPPIGASNVTTRTKGRTKVFDKTIDNVPGRRAELVNAAIAHIVHQSAQQPFHLHDVVIHGLRVRVITNSEHLIDFWRDNWYSPEDWREATGVAAQPQPRIVVYALSGLEDQPEAAYYSLSTGTVIFFNTAYYGQLKSWVLGAVGRILADELGIHSIHGACAEYAKHGVLYIAPTGTGKSTSSYGLMRFPETRFHSDDWVYVRYARTTRHGQLVVPLEASLAGGAVLRGYRCQRWLDHGPTTSATLRCLDLSNRTLTVNVADLDLTVPPRAFAYTSEKVFYLRSNIIENFPETFATLLQAKLENVPEATAAFVEKNRAVIDTVLDQGQSANDVLGGARRSRSGEGRPPDYLVADLFAFDNARAMLDISRVFSPERVFTNPMEPVELKTIFLLKRDQSDTSVLEALPIDRFMERLLIGEAPDGGREIAYNAYRAVDDVAELAAVRRLEESAKTSNKSLYQHFLSESADVLPASLSEEFELFRVMYNSAVCYDLNTTLQRDPLVRSRREAVELSLRLIVKGIESRARDLRLTLSDYRTAIGA